VHAEDVWVTQKNSSGLEVEFPLFLVSDLPVRSEGQACALGFITEVTVILLETPTKWGRGGVALISGKESKGNPL